ncbi:Chondroitin proteoglycan 3 [Toxocara canis]|uniref:Chondroitin proteoglycan 3 n=2 Tax=Toxocara canis TaxID=6265 RepID=A0A0B2VIK7_TOXCA|nr:Chondroitin proteoglycan 3 [Toxocara canis]VDM43578.1 unnamed protein product [Toxocara canis]
MSWELLVCVLAATQVFTLLTDKTFCENYGATLNVSKRVNGEDLNSELEEGIRDVIVVVLQQPRRKITMTKQLFEARQWQFERASNEACNPFRSCFDDKDCGGHACVGLALNKCNCGACISLLPCKDDSTCGGLRGAYNLSSKSCDCSQGFKENVVDRYAVALTTICNLKDCKPNNDDCFGLPCNMGFCSCL